MSKLTIPFSNPNSQNSLNYKPGFLLIEIILSIFLISIFGFYLCGWYSQLLNINKEAITRSQAINLACSVADQFKVYKNFAPDKINNKNNKFTIDYNIKTFDKNFNFIEIKISWQNYLNNKSFVKLTSGYS